jgi:hypothetical protein
VWACGRGWAGGQQAGVAAPLWGVCWGACFAALEQARFEGSRRKGRGTL